MPSRVFACFERVPILVLQLPEVTEVEIGKCGQDVRTERFRACLARQMLRDLATGACERMDGNWIGVDPGRQTEALEGAVHILPSRLEAGRERER